VPEPLALPAKEPENDPLVGPDAEALAHDDPDIDPLAVPLVGVHVVPSDDNCENTVTEYESEPHPLCATAPDPDELPLADPLETKVALPLVA
jgi:hypothetical protein